MRLAIACLLVATPFASAQIAPGAATPPGSAPSPPQPAPRPMLILIDPAHGGSDSGAHSPGLVEKDLTLAIARRLRQQLGNRGVWCQLLRDSDGTFSADQRAGTANALKPTLYITIHASSMGTGLRIFSAILPISGNSRGPFVDWQTAQSSSLDRSRYLQQQLFATIQKMGFPVRSLIAPLQPLNHVRAPALAIEVAPTTDNTAQLATAHYQDMVSAALASALSSLLSSVHPATGTAP